MTALPLRHKLRVVAPPPDAAQILAALPSAVVVLDEHGRFEAANHAAEEFFGLSLGQLRKTRLADVVAEASPIFSLLAQVRETGVTLSGRDITLAGPRLPARAAAVQLALLGDTPDRVVITFAGSEAARTLDRQTQSRTAARSVAGLAAMLAHEVKNPLSGIRGAAQLLESSAPEPADRDLAVLIREEADRIRALVDRMEVFSGRPEPRAPVNIHRVLEHVRRLALSGFAAHLRITEAYDPSLPPVLGNRDQLVQVMLNLVKNAAEALENQPDGEITLGTTYQHGIRVAAPGAAGSRNCPLLVTVRDNGPGIAPELDKSLFNPFVTTKQGGSGLGLALVAKVIGDHEGLVEMESNPGRTEFRVFLPVHDGRDA
jgi:two-component system nitrogen regulation sensor histidine kinase GlnL